MRPRVTAVGRLPEGQAQTGYQSQRRPPSWRSSPSPCRWQRPPPRPSIATPRSIEFVCSVEAEHLVTVGAPCPDHLVHTKRGPLWIPYDPDIDDPGALRERIGERAEAFRAGYRDYVEAHGDETTVPADPDPRIVLIQHLGLISSATTTKDSAVSRDLYHRAIEVMAGAHALGEFVSLDADRASRSSTGRSSSTSSPRRPLPASCRARSRS